MQSPRTGRSRLLQLPKPHRCLENLGWAPRPPLGRSRTSPLQLHCLATLRRPVPPRQLFSFGQKATSSCRAQSSRQPPAPGGDGLPGSSLAAAADRFTQQFDAQQPLPAAPVSSENRALHDSLAKAAQAFDKQVGGQEPANPAQQTQSSSQPWPGAQAGTNSRAEEGAPHQVRDHGKSLQQERPGLAGSSGERAPSGPPLPDGFAGFAFGQASRGMPSDLQCARLAPIDPLWRAYNNIE